MLKNCGKCLLTETLVCGILISRYETEQNNISFKKTTRYLQGGNFMSKKNAKEKYIFFDPVNNKWIAQPTKNGKRMRKKRFSTIEEAVAYRDEILNATTDIGNDSTFDQLFQEFIKRKQYQTDIKNVSLNQYKSVYKKYFASIAGKRVATLSQDDYQEVLYQVAGMSKVMETKLKSIMTGVCDIAEERNIIEKNRARKIKVKTSKPKRRGKDKYITDREIETFKNTEDCERKDVLTALFFTGWRVNEVLRLQKRNIDLHNKMFLHVGSKTESSIDRDVPIHDDLFPLIEKYYNQPTGKNGYIFSFITETKDENEIQRQLYSAENGINYYCGKIWGLNENNRPIHTVHHIRHTFATRLDEIGIQSSHLDELGGWKQSGGIRQQFYTHAQIESLRQSLNKLYYPTLKDSTEFDTYMIKEYQAN